MKIKKSNYKSTQATKQVSKKVFPATVVYVLPHGHVETWRKYRAECRAQKRAYH